MLKTKEGCGGHEIDREGGISDVGYSEPYLIFYVEENNKDFQSFADEVDKKLHKFKNSGLLGIENVKIESNQWSTNTHGIKEYKLKIHIIPTKGWCENNGKKYIPKHEEPGMFDEKKQTRKNWEKQVKNFQNQLEKFNENFGDYFRSDEVIKIRDEFFEVFNVPLGEWEKIPRL